MKLNTASLLSDIEALREYQLQLAAVLAYADCEVKRQLEAELAMVDSEIRKMCLAIYPGGRNRPGEPS